MRRICQKTAGFFILILMLANAPSVSANAGGAPVVEEPYQGQPVLSRHAGQTSPCPCHLEAERLRADMRKLWIDHASWTRDLQVSSLAGLEDREAVLARVLQNLQDIGDALQPYYGEEAGNRLTELLREHGRIAAELTEAIQKGHREDTYKYRADWQRNAEDLAIFLNKANPNWPAQELKPRLEQYLDQIEEGLNARLSKDWPTEARLYGEAEDQLIRLADMLAEGIVKQFPERFGITGPR
ncbi:glycosyltransferase [Paenibacillus timonensis]|uniref:Glycosyltransferase n=1 Tax=Paenibacillus timonensis TaxID=225915 RepID=A0ABW3SDM9_9BACL|nr:glycosyltransferase [Paenibacillus timonensis]MCH1641401.1 glycosyltransferase [Paenibacillus timonensis]